MDMSMSMSMTATSASSTPSTTSGMNTPDSSSSSSMMMPASEMAMVFFQSIATPLFSLSWIPASEGSYAGTCIFLIVLATIHEILLAVRRTVFAPSSFPEGFKLDSAANDSLLRGTRRSRLALLRDEWAAHPFRVAEETARAAVGVVASGIGYLLMIAVMTMNVGYFLSVLGGIFLGTLMVGRIGQDVQGHH